MDREAWHAAVHGVAESWTWQSDWTELNWTEEKCVCKVDIQPISISFLYIHIVLFPSKLTTSKKISSEIQYVNIIFWILLPSNNETGDP